jgi:hypothetical protein
LPIVELLLMNKADVNIREKEDKSTALHIGNLHIGYT